MKHKAASFVPDLLARKRDLHLVQATLSGEKRAFSKLVSLGWARVMAVGKSFFRRDEDVEDFCQDVFLRAYQKLQVFKGESLFSTWVSRIAFTQAVNRKARTKDVSPLENEELIEDRAATPEEQMLQDVQMQAVRSSVDELPQRYACCVRMYFFGGMSHEQIAEATGLPLNTVKSHIFRAKKMLAKKLEPYR